MHNKVVFRAAKAAVQAGLPALRFNFRGVGKSSGSFADGAGERDDVSAALDYLGARFPGVSVCLAGFSFGASVGLAVGANHPRVVALIGLGVPVAFSGENFLHGVLKPKLFIHGTRDEFTPRAQMEEFYRSLAAPKEIHWVENADHFFTGKARGSPAGYSWIPGVGAGSGKQRIDLAADLSSCRFILEGKGKHVDETEEQESQPLYCPVCGVDVPDPLVCGDCAAVICRKCGTPLEKVDELGIG